MIADWEEVRKGVRMCLNKLNLHDMHDDVEQEAMINAFIYQHTYRGDATLSTWGYAIARSAAMKFFRDRKKEFLQFDGDFNVNFPEYHTDLGESDDEWASHARHTKKGHYICETYGEEITDEELTQEDIFDRYSTQLFHAILENVSEEWQPRFVDRYLVGMRYRDIAVKYDIPIGTVQSSLSRMRSAMKESLGALAVSFDEECTKRVIKNALEKLNAKLQANQ